MAAVPLPSGWFMVGATAGATVLEPMHFASRAERERLPLRS